MRRLLLVTAFLFLLALPAAAEADEAELIYQSGAVLEIDLGISAESEAKLEAEPDEDVAAKFTARLTDGTPGGSTVLLASERPVKVHLKGHKSGSFRKLTEKAAFKLKFKEENAFRGLRKMTLNNMVEDPSMIHETLAYSLFRAVGVPASRTGFAYLRVNGKDFGVYLDLENLDETFLKAHYGEGNTLHLYEGEYGADADAAGIATLGTEPPEGQPKFEMDEGEGPPTDLEVLASAVAASSPSFSSRLTGLADLTEMTRMWAVEKYISHCDGYSGEEASNKPNNYYLHSDLSGLFQMLPWGTDNTWQVERRIGFDGPAGLLLDGCLGDDQCFRSYYAALQALEGQVATLDPDALAASTAALLKPWQELEEDESTRGEHSVAEIEAAVDRVQQYIEERPSELVAWLKANTPPPLPPPSEPPPTKTTAPPPTLTREAVVKHPHSFTLRLVSSAAGRVSGQATMRTGDGDKVVCSDQVELGAPGTVALRCDLSAAARERLAKRWLRFPVSAHLQAADGQRADLATVVRLPRG
jgi:hypothetical protein